jgi:hypothetical protein
MHPQNLLPLLAVAVLTCCHGPSRIMPAYRSVVNFCVEYGAHQRETFAASDHFDAALVPDTGFRSPYNPLSDLYVQVRKHRYHCRFAFPGRTSFRVWCDPEPKSGMHGTFYLDEHYKLHFGLEEPAGLSTGYVDLHTEDRQRLTGSAAPY